MILFSSGHLTSKQMGHFLGAKHLPAQRHNTIPEGINFLRQTAEDVLVFLCM